MPRRDVKGMCAAFEFLVMTPAIANLVRDNKTFRIDSAIQTGKKFGMQLLDDHLWQLYTEGKIDATECVDKSKDPDEMARRIQQAGGAISRSDMSNMQVPGEPPRPQAVGQ